MPRAAWRSAQAKETCQSQGFYARPGRDEALPGQIFRHLARQSKHPANWWGGRLERISSHGRLAASVTDGARFGARHRLRRDRSRQALAVVRFASAPSGDVRGCAEVEVRRSWLSHAQFGLRLDRVLLEWLSPSGAPLIQLIRFSRAASPAPDRLQRPADK